MPILTGDSLRFRIGLNRQDLSVPIGARCIRMNAQLAKIPAKRLLLIQIDLLVSSEQYLVFCQRDMEIFDLLMRNGVARSMPEISAPMRGVTGLTWILA